MAVKKKRKKSVLEQAFQKEILHSVPSGSHYEKIPDMPRSKFTRFLVNKPYDWYCLYKNKWFCVENKVWKFHNAWPYEKIAEHQIEKLYEAYKNGALSYVFLNIRYGRSKKRVCKLFAIHIIAFEKLYVRYVKSDKKSIPLIEFEHFDTFDYERVVNDNGDKEIRWKLDVFFNNNVFHKKAIRK